MTANKSHAQQLMVVGLYAAMGPDQQLQVFQPAPAGTRKVLHSLYLSPYSKQATCFFGGRHNLSGRLTHLRLVLGFCGAGLYVHVASTMQHTRSLSLGMTTG